MSPRLASGTRARRPLRVLELGAGGPSAPLNVLLVLWDDIGRDQLASYDDENAWADGYPYAATPRLAELVASGVRFSRCYGMPICSPTRASILTGRHPYQHRIAHAVNTGGTVRLASDSLTIPRVLLSASSNAYRARAAGKWHLGFGRTDGLSPTRDGGFQRYRGALPNLNNDSMNGYGAGSTPPPGGGTWYGWDSVSVSEYDGSAAYNPSDEVADVLGWIGSMGRPWYLQHWQHLAHSPYHWPPASLHSYGAAPGTIGALSAYRAMTEAADTLLGQLLDGMAPSVRERTLVIVAADNGTPDLMLDASSSAHTDGNAPPDVYDPDHAKQTVYEQGIRVPLVIAGPGVRAGVTSDALVSVCDLFPTVLEACGVDWAAETVGIDIEGRSLWPVLAPGGSDEADAIRTYAFSAWAAEGFTPGAETFVRRAVMSAAGPKLLQFIETGPAEPVEELYDVLTDPLETTPLELDGPDYSTLSNVMDSYLEETS